MAHEDLSFIPELLEKYYHISNDLFERYIAAAYVPEMLAQEERALVEYHTSVCDRCRREVELMQETLKKFENGKL